MTTKSKPNLTLLLRRTAKRLNMTEESILDEIRKICLLIGNQLHFGYYDTEDIQQEGVIIGLEALKKYDFARPLANFLYVGIRNQILNLKRKKFTRTDAPCMDCHQSVDGHTSHDNGQYCIRYERWFKINFAKRSLACPLELEDLESKDEVVETAEVKDLLTQIDKLLPVEMRAAYLRMRAGEKVLDVDRRAVEEFVKELLDAQEI